MLLVATSKELLGGESLQRSWGVLKPGGRMITITAKRETTGDARVKQAFFGVEPNQEELIQIRKLLQTKRLQTVVDAVLPLAQASAAYTGKVKERRGRGKLVIAVVAPDTSGGNVLVVASREGSRDVNPQ